MSRRRGSFVRLSLFAGLIALAYGASLGNEFVFDDAIFMERDPRVRSLTEARRLLVEPLWGFSDQPGQRTTHQYYRPLQQFPLVLSNVLFAGAPWPAHLISLLLHLANVWLLYRLLARLGAGDLLAFALVSLFAVHPANSEAVLWVSDVAGLGATACTLGAVLVHASRLAWWRAPLLVAPLGLAALWFKESGILLPLFLLTLDMLVRPSARGTARAALVADFVALGGATAIYFDLRYRALGGALPGIDALELGPAELLINAVALLPSYLRALLWPFDLNMYHDFAPARGMGDPRFVGGLLLMLAALSVTVASWRRRPRLALGLVWAGIAVAPHLLVRWPKLNVFAERYLYMAMIGLAVAALASVRYARVFPAPTIRRIAMTAWGALIVLFVTVDRARTREWHDEVAIYTKTLTQSERAELVRNNLSLRYLTLGQPLQGIPIHERLLQIDPDFPSGWHNLGLLRLAAGDHRAAQQAFEQGRAREPRNAATLLNLGYTHDLLGEREQAVRFYFEGLAVDPDDTKLWHNLAVIASEQKQFGNARLAATRVLAIDPADTSTKGLLDRIPDASASVRPDPKQTLQRCEAARKAADDERFGEAIALLQTAAWLDERAPLPHQYLANLAYQRGRHNEALVHQGQALERDPDNEMYQRNLIALQRLLAPHPAEDERPAADTQE